ncbi:energy transducer TonB [Pseudotamlana carrageenivorans]|uniref:Energy transducer TonB n=1 Tax=Pseudotamlana carrageenivorans TaxID=2069432 RepID=A0A2I7SG29_9FLAO|nr:energy transducer TonB [Tamlana carrageenivorans]AUS04857.1 energy transducer TonB [Tamlana carrageenivorans]
MKIQSKNHDFRYQDSKTLKKSQKHDVNLKKDTTIYFQVGVILCLLVVFGLLELNFETTIPKVDNDFPPIDELAWVEVPRIKTIVPEIVEPIKKRTQKEPVSFEVIKNDEPEAPFFEDIQKEIPTESVSPETLPPLVEKPIDDEPVSFVAIQEAPIYPGCEKADGNEARKKCMSDKITQLVQKKFEGSDIASDYGLTGRQRIQVQFTIDKTGHVTNVKTRAPNPELEQEAKRVINFIPEMTPGRQHDKHVEVVYTLPIVFQVQ